ncbi:MAG: VOC family protein [Alphaproteobacteria bacterium]|nr:VOC family protein [Alphaproteobacteria bacterium]MCB9697278.1 VOC family protein [Alphaproteobacteria bacterium]
MNGHVSWFEVMGSDADRLVAFYAELFGWKLVRMPDMEYHTTAPDWTGVPGGVGKAPEGPGWTTFYVQVDDVAAAIERATTQGGRVLMPKTELPGGTTIAVVADPEGHPIGLSHSAT